MSEKEWTVLDALADGLECIASMWPGVKESVPGITGAELKGTLYDLYRRGLVFADKAIKPLTRDDVLAEETENKYKIGNYYFGMTATGAAAWEEASAKYFEPPDWSGSHTGSLDLLKQEGYVDGTSRDVCLNALPTVLRYSDVGHEWQIDMDSLVHCEIEGFQARYYKYISGGHRISFSLKRR